jgi:stage II sporulation protein D
LPLKEKTVNRLCPFLLLLAVFSRPASAEDVQVRLYSAHPPNTLKIRATEGQLHWKACSTCEERTEQSLSIRNKDDDKHAEWFLTGSYELQPESAPPFSTRFPLRIQARTGGLLIVMTMPVEEYLQHVLMAESGDFQNPEAQKAMAVVARTYAIRFSHQHAVEGFDLCDTTHCQVFSWKNVNARVRTAVTSTQGEFLSYEGKPAATYYHQNCGGTIAAASEAWAQVFEPYLQVHADPFCLTTGGLKWETTLTHAQIDRALQASGLQAPASWKTLEIASHSKSGRARTLNLTGGNPTSFSLSASSFRFSVDRTFGWNQIRSDFYEIRNFGDKVLFSGRGAGHGVGLCQAGAEEMARQGKNYREILDFYYPGTQIATADKETWQKRSSERFDLVSSNPEADSEIFPLAERLLRQGEETVGWRLSSRVKLQVFSSLDSYRDTTGEPGWVAASTRGHTIRLQPLVELRRRSILDSTLRHELFHLLVETRASPSAPLWFREGLVLQLSSPASPDATSPNLTVEQVEQILRRGDSRLNTEKAYASAHKMVATLMQRYGKQAVLAWLSDGLPVEVLRNLLQLPASVPHS